MAKVIIDWQRTSSGALVIIYEDGNRTFVRHFSALFVRSVEGKEIKPSDMINLTDEEIDLYIITHRLGGG